MKAINKHCHHCDKDLPKRLFTSTRAKYCIACQQLRRFELQNAMQQRSIDRLKNKKPKTVGIVRLSDLKGTAQRVFNKWIRSREKKNGCISCGNLVASSYEAGHYLAQGSTGALRYHPDNVHKQCYSCNHFKHANLIEYRISLIKKIGVKRVKWLEDHRHDVKKWTRPELDEIIKNYKI